MRFRHTRVHTFAVLILILATVILRLYQLNSRSLWTDESITLIRIQQSWGDIFANRVYLLDVVTTDTNPFLYFALLKVWVQWAGFTEYAIKLFSALASILMVPLTYKLGKALFNVRVGFVAAIFMMLSPGVQWYSHEVRMYSLVGCISLLGGLAIFKTLSQPLNRAKTWAWGCLWLLSAVLGVLTHYTFVVQGLAFAGLFAVQIYVYMRNNTVSQTGAVPKHTIFLVAGVIVASSILAFAGLFLWSTELGRRLLVGQEKDYFFIPVHMMWNSIVNGFVMGFADDPTGGYIVWTLTALFAWAFARLLIGAGVRRLSHWVLWCGGVIPVILWFCISLVKANFQGMRHMYLILPYVTIAVAALIDPLHQSKLDANTKSQNNATTRPLGVLMALLVLTMQGFGLNVALSGKAQQDDWRSLFHYVREQWLDGDVMVLNSTTVQGSAALYAPSIWQWTITPPVSIPFRDAVDKAQLQNLLQAYKRVWLIHEKPNSEIVAWLKQNAYFRQDKQFAGRNTIPTVELFDSESPILKTVPQGATIYNTLSKPTSGISWVGDLIEVNPFSPTPNPNRRIHLFFTRTPGALPKQLVVNYRLIYSDQLWLNWEHKIQLDATPIDFVQDLFFRERATIPIPLGLPLLPYRLNVIVTADGNEIQNFESEIPDAWLRQVRIAEWVNHPMLAKLATQTTNVSLLGAEFPSVVKPGDFVPLATTWGVKQAIPPQSQWWTQASIHSLSVGQISSMSRSWEIFTSKSTNLTQYVNQPVRDLLSLQIPESTTPGVYWLKIKLGSAEQMQSNSGLTNEFNGLIWVENYPPEPVEQQIENRLSAMAGELSLLGFRIAQSKEPIKPGMRLDISIFWQVKAIPKDEGVLFVHVIAPDGKLAGQSDSAPLVNGKPRSTQTYRMGEGISQQHQIMLRADAPAGEYRVLAGIYNRTNTERWQASQNGSPARDNLIELTRFMIN